MAKITDDEFNSVCNTIRGKTLTTNQHNDLIYILRRSSELRNSAARANLVPGLKVEFESSKGYTVRGTVTRVLRKNVEVKDEYGMKWRCSPGLLHPVEEPCNLREIHRNS